jgi:hypothetical protein
MDYYDVVGVVLLMFVTTAQLVISAMVMISSSVDFQAPHHCRCLDDHRHYDYVSVWHYVTLSVSFYHYYHHVMSTYSYSVLLLQQYDYLHGYDDVGCITFAVEHGQSNRLRRRMILLLDDLLDERHEKMTFGVGFLATHYECSNSTIKEKQMSLFTAPAKHVLVLWR